MGVDQLNSETMISNSPIRLIDGGSAILVKFAISHQVDISGKIIWNPRASTIVRVWVRS